ncbi:hypothetical protein FHS86_000009 [Roseimarinus sediminis]
MKQLTKLLILFILMQMNFTTLNALELERKGWLK